MATAAGDRGNVTRSLQRAVGLLRLLSTHARIGWRLSDLAQQSGLDPATVHRLLARLCSEGLATRVPGSRHYTLGPLAFALGLSAAPYFDLGRLSHERLAALAQELQGTLFLKMRSGADSVCIARHDGLGSHQQALLLDVGGRRPLCLTAGGVAMLLRLPRAEQRGIEAQNRRSITRQDAGRWPGVRRMLDRSRVHGRALNLGDIATGIAAVGVPVCGSDGLPVAALALAMTGKRSALSESGALALVDRLRDEAAHMEPLLQQLRY